MARPQSLSNFDAKDDLRASVQIANAHVARPRVCCKATKLRWRKRNSREVLAIHDECLIHYRVGESDGALDVERGASQILGFVITPLFDENTGKADDEYGSHGRILASRLEDAKESAARVRLGFAQPALFRLFYRYHP